MKRHPRPTAAVVALCALMAAASCAPKADEASRSALRALAAGATTTTAPKPTATTAPSCGNPTASLRPQAPLPAPGSLPAGSFMAAIRQRGRLVVGVDQNTLLFGYLNPEDGQIEGFDIDMLRQVAKAIFGDDGQDSSTHLEFKAVSSAQRIPVVRDGSVDIVADLVTINCARAQQVSFSSVYFDAGQRVLVPINSAVASAADLGGKRVCATAGSTSIDNIRNPGLTHAARPPIAVERTDRTDCLVELQAGTIDAISTDDTILAGFAAQDPLTKIVGPKFTNEPYGMAINQQHPDFVRFVNAVLDRMRIDGTWTAIWNKWLARVTDQPAPAPPPATYRD